VSVSLCVRMRVYLFLCVRARARACLCVFVCFLVHLLKLVVGDDLLLVGIECSTAVEVELLLLRQRHLGQDSCSQTSCPPERPDGRKIELGIGGKGWRVKGAEPTGVSTFSTSVSWALRAGREREGER